MSEELRREIAELRKELDELKPQAKFAHAMACTSIQIVSRLIPLLQRKEPIPPGLAVMLHSALQSYGGAKGIYPEDDLLRLREWQKRLSNELPDDW